MTKKYLLKTFNLLRNNFPLPLILFLVALIHLYKSQALFFWQVDEDIVGLTIKRILVDHRPQLIGFPFPGGLYPGPAVYYILSIPYLIFGMNPLGLPMITALIATFTTFLVFYCGKEIFNDLKTGLFAAIIFGFSFLANIYSKLFNGLTFAPILALLSYLILTRSIKLKKTTNILFLSLILVLSVQNEGSSISIFFLILASFFIFKIRIQLKHILFLLSIFFLAHLPLLIFELRHQFVLFDKLSQFIAKGSGQLSLSIFLKNFIANLLVFPTAFVRLVLPTGRFDVVEQIYPCLEISSYRSFGQPLLIAIISVILIISFYILLKNGGIGGKILTIHLSILVLGLGIYSMLIGSYKHEWITVIFLPGFSLILGFYLSRISKLSRILRIWVFIFIGVFLVLNLRAIFLMSSRFGLLGKMSATQYAVSKIGSNSFFLDSIGSCYEQGYNYLFWYLRHPPSYTKNLIIDPELTGQKGEVATQLGIIMVAHSDKNKFEFYKKYAEYKKRTIGQKMFNDIEVLIVK